MSHVAYLNDGRRIIALHKPSGEQTHTATAATIEAAALAAEIINEGMRLNDNRKYTASARMYARLDDIDGYHELERPRIVNPDPMDVCAACGQTLLTTPDDPSPTLFCDACLASLEARRQVRPSTIAANPPQGGLF